MSMPTARLWSRVEGCDETLPVVTSRCTSATQDEDMPLRPNPSTVQDLRESFIDLLEGSGAWFPQAQLEGASRGADGHCVHARVCTSGSPQAHTRLKAKYA